MADGVEPKKESLWDKAKAVVGSLTEAFSPPIPVEFGPQADAERQKQAEFFELRQREWPAKEQEINDFFANKLSVLAMDSGEVEDRVTELNPGGTGLIEITFKAAFTLRRSLAAMGNREAEIARYNELFYGVGMLKEKPYYDTKWALIYNDGRCEMAIHDMELRRAFCDAKGIKNQADGIRFVMGRWGTDNKEAAIAKFLTIFSEMEQLNPGHYLVKEFRSKIIGGSNWLTAADFAGTAFSYDEAATKLFIGKSETGAYVWFDSEGSVISIAPPGSGKTQCHVLPNLVHYRGPALVLDVKGECYEQTAGWRATNIGPVFRFNPLQPDTSAHYNPLAHLSDDPDTLWEDCRLLADLLVVPENHHDPSWENRARNVVTGALAWLVLFNPPDKRTMGRVVDVVSKIGWAKFVDECRLSELRPLSRLGHALQDMPEKQLEGVLDAARRHLAVWEGERVERVTATSDWSPEMFRDGTSPTLYVCIPPNEIESYAPLLRVLFAQHIRHLLKTLPPHSSTGDTMPILFMLDELPRLGPMRPVEEALEVGRQYGIRLWLFAQSLGQLQKAYPNADGMIGSCALRIYMNPSSHDGTAKRLSEELGYAESIIDGSRQPMLEASALTGPEFAEMQLAFARNTRPAKFGKGYGFKEPVIAERLGNPMP